VSVQPLETEFGRKRVIDQSSCNKDFSCLDGFCPALVTVHGARPKKAEIKQQQDFPSLPRPLVRAIGAKPCGILVTGVGGTGVVTIGAILGMAAHHEQRLEQTRGGPESRIERLVDAMFFENVGRDKRELVNGLSEFWGHASPPMETKQIQATAAEIYTV
jgi:hypothetical protein